MRKIFLIYAATLLMGAGLAACSSDDNSGDNTKDQEASLPTPTGNAKYLLKYRVVNDDSSVLAAKYKFSGNGLLLADSSYATGNPGSHNLMETRELTYGDKGLSTIVYKVYKDDGTVDPNPERSYTATYTYSGNTISEKIPYQDGEYVHYMENGKIVKREDTDDNDVINYSYEGNDCTMLERIDGEDSGKDTIVNVFDNQKNPFYNNWFACDDNALGEHNTKTCKFPSTDSFILNVEYLSYNSQGYPTRYKDKDYDGNGTIIYTYQYIGW
jgi:hypothetical protein